MGLTQLREVVPLALGSPLVLALVQMRGLGKLRVPKVRRVQSRSQQVQVLVLALLQVLPQLQASMTSRVLAQVQIQREVRIQMKVRVLALVPAQVLMQVQVQLPAPVHDPRTPVSEEIQCLTLKGLMQAQGMRSRLGQPLLLLLTLAQLGREQVFLQWVQVRAPKGRSVQSPPQVQVPAPVQTL